jgi:hypothetical protein
MSHGVDSRGGLILQSVDQLRAFRRQGIYLSSAQHDRRDEARIFELAKMLVHARQRNVQRGRKRVAMKALPFERDENSALRRTNNRHDGSEPTLRENHYNRKFWYIGEG